MVSNCFNSWCLFGPGNLIFIYLSHTQHPLHQVFVRWMNEGRLTQMAFTLSRFFCQQVAFKSLIPAYFSRPCNFKSLFCAGVGFHLWHVLNFGRAKVREIFRKAKFKIENVALGGFPIARLFYFYPRYNFSRHPFYVILYKNSNYG